jgi:hypothetical protein
MPALASGTTPATPAYATGILLQGKSDVEASRATQGTVEEAHHKIRVEEYMQKAGRTGRLAMALLGGYALIIPMIIMSLDALHKSLIVSSVFVDAFAVGVAIFGSENPGDLILATAAYATVLVVFVGVSIHS